MNMKYKVTGYALVPLRIEIEVNSTSHTCAKKTAERLFETTIDKKTFIVGGSEDLACVYDFIASESALTANQNKPAN